VKERIKRMKKKGISLIVLVITIVVIIILAAAVIISINNNNPIKNAKEARNKSDVATLKEKVELEVISYKLNNSITGGNLTVSEIIDKLKENDIINEDMIFKQNNNYQLTYSGDIIDVNGDIKDNIKLFDKSLVYDIADEHINLNSYDGKCIVTIVDGKKENESFIANDEPYGYKFAYWVNQDNKIVSLHESIAEYCCYNGDIIIPVYVKNGSTINKKNVVFCNAYRYWKNDGSGKQRVAFTINSFTTELKPVKTGVVRTYNQENIKDLYVNNSNVTTNLNDISNPYKNFCSTFGVNLGTVSSSQTMYLKGVTIFENQTTGEQEIIYSDLLTLLPLTQ